MKKIILYFSFLVFCILSNLVLSNKEVLAEGEYDKATKSNVSISYSIDGNLYRFLAEEPKKGYPPGSDYSSRIHNSYAVPAFALFYNTPMNPNLVYPDFNFFVQGEVSKKAIENAELTDKTIQFMSSLKLTETSDVHYGNCQFNRIDIWNPTYWDVSCKSPDTTLNQIESVINDLSKKPSEKPKYAVFIISGFYKGSTSTEMNDSLSTLKERALANNIHLYIYQYQENHSDFYKRLEQIALETQGKYGFSEERNISGISILHPIRTDLEVLFGNLLSSARNNNLSGKSAIPKIQERDYSQADSQTFVSDPIDTSTGALIANKNLFYFNGSNNFSLDLSYNSLLLNKGTVGYGWSHNFEQKVKIVSEDVIEYYQNPNSKTNLNKKQDNIFMPSTNNKQIKMLEKNDSGYTLHLKDNTKKLFDLEGKLIMIEKKTAVVKLVYSGGLLNKVEEFSLSGKSNGKYLTFSYDKNKLLTSIKNNANLEVILNYNNSLDLISIKDVNDKISKFIYDISHKIVKGVDNEEVNYMTNEYDDKNRVVKQYDSYNNFTTLSYVENFIDNRLMTTVTNREGDSRQLLHDSEYNLIKLTDELGDVTTYKYDEQNNRISETNSHENTTTMEYDNNNNLIVVKNPLGYKTTMEYDSNDNLIKIINSKGHFMSIEYNEQNQLISTTDLNGNKTLFKYLDGLLVEKIEPTNRITKYEYSKGNLIKTVDPLGNEFTYKVDDMGNTVEVKDPNGNITKFTYNNKNDLMEIKNPLEKVLINTYDSYSQITSITDYKGILEEFVYDNNGNLSSVQKGNQKYVYQYDKEDRLIKTITPKGNFSIVTYNPLGQIIEEVDEEGVKTSYTYDKVGNLTSETIDKVTTSYQYDELRNLISVTDSEGYKTTYKYNELNQRIESINAKGNKITFNYDKTGNLISQTDSLNNKVSYEYDTHKNMVKFTDAKGFSTIFKYDNNNNLIKSINPLGQAASYSYDKNGNLIQSFDALGNVTTREYDSLNRLIKTTDSLGHSHRVEYDEIGNVIALYDAKGNKISSIDYDEYNNQISRTDALGSKSSNKYDNENNLVETLDSLNRVNKISYDALGQVISAIDSNGMESIAAYNEFGNTVSYTDTNTNQTTYLYDKLGQVLKETNASGNFSTYNYDEIGNLTSAKNARKQQTDYKYNSVGNIVQRTDVDGLISYTYDDNYNLTEIKEINNNKTSTVLRTYDALNRITSYTDTYGNKISYKYDEVGNLVEMIYPNQKTVTYSYDKVGNLTSVTDWNNNQTKYIYDENYRLIKTENSNGTVELRTYDKKGQMTTLVSKKSNGETISKAKFTYDSVGNVIQENDQLYSYDNLNRVINSNQNQYEYDPMGNILSATRNIATTADTTTVDTTTIDTVKLSYGPDNRLKSYNDNELSVDSDGNLITVPLSGENLTAEYDSRNRLSSIGENSYKYDMENNRISKVENDKETRFTYNTNSYLSQLLMETDTQGNPTSYYVYGMGLISKIDVLDTSEETYIYHFDRRGSTVAMTDLSEETVNTYSYDVYGEIIEENETVDNSFQYNGQYGVFTDDNGLYFMRSRYYNPDIKRFINRDIVVGSLYESQSLNRFAYTNGNPVSHLDPFGLSREEDSKGKEMWDMGLDLLQGGLAVFGFVPVVGEIADIANALISFGRGDIADGFLNLASAVPGVGNVVAVGKVANKVGDAASDAKNLIKICEPKSFASGTLVLTDEGLIPIEDIELGDYVLAKGTETGDIRYKEVITLFKRIAYEGSYIITVEGEEIVTTPNHPFWVEGKGWLRADELTVEDFFIDEEGNKLDIISIKIDLTPLVVYNFEVEDYHTYFISDLKILTHNLNYTNCKASQLTTDDIRNFNKWGDLLKGTGLQRHHILQDALFGGKYSPLGATAIPHKEGLTIPLQGYAKSVGSEHNKFHDYIERNVFDPYRNLNALPGNANRQVYPTVGDYFNHLEGALINAGVTSEAANKIKAEALKEAQSKGFYLNMRFTGIPSRASH